MPKKKINKLTKLKTLEVSLVSRGANNKLFALTKSQGENVMLDLIIDVLKAEAEGEKELIETLKSEGKSEDFIAVATANFRLQTGFKDVVDAKGLADVAKAAGLEGDEEEKETADEETKEEIPSSEAPTAEIPKGDEMTEVEKNFNAKLEEIKKSNEEKDARIAKLEGDIKHKELVAKCNDLYAHVPGISIDEQATMLAKAYDVSEEFGKQLETQWSQMASVVKENLNSSTVTKTFSTNSKLAEVAKSIREKNPELDEDLSIAKALEDNPELYEG